MSMEVIAQRPVAAVSRPSRSARWMLVADLARVHAIRILRHPILLVGFAWYVVGMAVSLPDTPYEMYAAVTGMVAFFVGPLAFFAANLVASSGRRSGADEWTPSLPMPERDRTVALLLACFAPALVAGVVNLGMLLLLDFNPAMPVAWQHVASVPVTVLGGAMLGVAVARLLPWTGVPLAVMVALVAVNVSLSSDYGYLGFYVDFAAWTDTDAIPALMPGSPSWHLAYLLALCGLAASGALLRDARRRWIPFMSGAAFGVVVLVAGSLQLP